MLGNIVDIEEAAIHTSLTQREGGIILFDFRQLFPASHRDS